MIWNQLFNGLEQQDFCCIWRVGPDTRDKRSLEAFNATRWRRGATCSRIYLSKTQRNLSALPVISIMSYLPDDLLLNCLACVSRLYYPTLSLVSKRFCSLLTSIELYKTRTLLGTIERCLYVCLSSPSSSKPHWFTLNRGPA